MARNMSAAEIKYRLSVEADMSLKDFAKSIKRHPSTVSMVIHRRRTSGPIMRQLEATLATARIKSKVED